MKKIFQKANNKGVLINKLIPMVFLSLLSTVVLFNAYNISVKDKVNASEDIASSVKFNSQLIEILSRQSAEQSKAISELSYVPRELLNANVLVLSDKGSGSGSVIKVDDTGTYILTAAHVVYSRTNVGKFEFTAREGIKVSYLNREDYVAIVIKANFEKDLAILKIRKVLPVTPVKIAKDEPEIGDTVWQIANPISLYGVINNGIFSTPDKRHSWVSISAYFGSSGGMCLNSKGEQIGVISVVRYSGTNNNFVRSATSYAGITRTKDLNKFLKGVL
jgi:S1-C subfamily serine protease